VVAVFSTRRRRRRPLANNVDRDVWRALILFCCAKKI